MVNDKSPSIYTDRGTIGSSEELDEYGVWIKAEPQDLSSAGGDELSGFDMDPGTGDGTFQFDESLSLPDDTPADEAASFNFDDSLPVFPAETASPEAASFDDDLSVSFPDIPGEESFTGETASFESSLEENENPEAFAAPDLEERLPAESIVSSGPEEGGAQGEVSTKLLMKIADELSSIKNELAVLKRELAEIRSGTGGEIPAAPVAKASGFFDPEDNEKIALTGDEMNNILHTADFTEETGADAAAGLGDDLNLGNIDAGFPAETSMEVSSTETHDMLADLDLSGDEELSLDTDLSGLDASLGESGENGEDGVVSEEAAPEESGELPPELDVDIDSLSIEDLLNQMSDEEPIIGEIGGDFDLEEIKKSREEAELKASSLEISSVEGESSVEEPSLDGEPSDIEFSTVDLSAGPSPDEDGPIGFPAGEDLPQEEEAPMTAAAEDISYLESDPAADIGPCGSGTEGGGELSPEDLSFDASALDGLPGDISSDDISSDDISIDLDFDDTSGGGEETHASFETSEGPDISEEEISIDGITLDGEADLDIPDFTSETLDTASLEETSLDTAPAEPDLPEPDQTEAAFDIPGLDTETLDTASLEETSSLDAAPTEPDLPEPEIEAVASQEVNFPEPAQANPAPAINVAAIPAPLKKELKTVLSYMDQLLESLPDNKIEEFAKSQYFDTYKKLFTDLGIG